MTPMSSAVAERSRKTYTRVLQALAEPGSQRNLAQELGSSESTVSRIKNEQLESCIAFLVAAGFKVVPAEVQCYAPEYVQALHVLAKRQIQENTRPAPLDWEN